MTTRPRGVRRFRVATTAAAALLVASLAAGQETYKDRRNGFSVKPPDKWPATPVEPQEEYAVAKWSGKRDFGNFETSLQVLVFNKVAKKKPAPPPIEGLDADLEELAASRTSYGRDDLFGKAGNYASYWRRRFWDEKFEMPKPTREISVKGFDTKVLLYDVFRPGAQDLAGKPARFWYMAAVYELPERQFVLEFVGGEPVREKLLPLYLEVVKSFRLLDPKEVEAAEDEEALAKLTDKQKALRIAEITKRQVPGWWFKETEEFVILTNLPDKRREMIDLVASQLKRIRRLYERDFPPPKKIEAVSIVRICKSREEYHNYGGSQGTAGYWAALQGELVMYSEAQKDQFFATLYHEAFHQYIYYCFGELAPHSWYNEGHGDYYGTAKFEGATATIKADKDREGVIKTALATKSHVPLKDLVRFSQAQYYANPQLCYAEGWSLVYFLRKGVPKGHPYEKILPRYFEVMQKTQDPEKSVAAAYEGVDFAKLEADWIEFIQKGRPATKP